MPHAWAAMKNKQWRELKRCTTANGFCPNLKAILDLNKPFCTINLSHFGLSGQKPLYISNQTNNKSIASPLGIRLILQGEVFPAGKIFHTFSGIVF
jgi:hypothetical protein